MPSVYFLLFACGSFCNAAITSADSNAAADQKYLVAYPVALFYLTFSMLTMF